MRILRNIIIVLLLLALFGIAVTGLMIEAPAVLGHTPDRINALGRSVITIMRPKLGLFWFWVVMFLGPLLVLLISIARPRRPMKIEVQMGGGKVVIMDSAIKKYIKNALSEIGEVNVKKIDLQETRNGIMTNLYADVKTRDNLPLIQRRMITRIRAALTEELGITNLADVHVFIRDFEVTGRPVRQMTKPDLADRKNRLPVVSADEAEVSPSAVLPQTTPQPSVDHVETIQPISNLETALNPEDDNSGIVLPQEEDTLPATKIDDLDHVDLSEPSEKSGEIIEDEIVLNRPPDSAFASAAEHFSKLDGRTEDSRAASAEESAEAEAKKFPWEKD